MLETLEKPKRLVLGGHAVKGIQVVTCQLCNAQHIMTEKEKSDNSFPLFGLVCIKICCDSTIEVRMENIFKKFKQDPLNEKYKFFASLIQGAYNAYNEAW